jgi:hypothetical protein
MDKNEIINSIEKGVLNAKNNRVPRKVSPVQNHLIRSSLFKIVERKEINSKREITKKLGVTEYIIKGQNLNMDTDFHLFIFILKRWEYNNRNRTKENFINKINISFSDLRSNLSLSDGTDIDALRKVKKSLNRLKETGITINGDNKTLKIEKLLKDSESDVKQRYIYVFLPDEIYELYKAWGGVTFVDLSLLNMLSTQYSKALYMYLTSQSHIFLNQPLTRLKDVFGLNETLVLTGNIEEDKILKKKINQREKNIKKAVGKAIEELIKVNFLDEEKTIVTNKQRNYKFAINRELSQAELKELADMNQGNNSGNGQQASQNNLPINNEIEEGNTKPQKPSVEINSIDRDRYGFLIISDKYFDINFERKKMNYLYAKHLVLESDTDPEKREYAKSLIKTPLIPDDFTFKNMDKNEIKLLIISKQISEPFNDAIEMGQNKLATEIIQTALDNPFK